MHPPSEVEEWLTRKLEAQNPDQKSPTGAFGEVRSVHPFLL
jgi:hypothetical protein